MIPAEFSICVDIAIRSLDEASTKWHHSILGQEPLQPSALPASTTSQMIPQQQASRITVDIQIPVFPSCISRYLQRHHVIAQLGQTPVTTACEPLPQDHVARIAIDIKEPILPGNVRCDLQGNRTIAKVV